MIIVKSLSVEIVSEKWWGENMFSKNIENNVKILLESFYF